MNGRVNVRQQEDITRAGTQEAERTDPKQTFLKPEEIWWNFPGCHGKEEILMWILITSEQQFYCPWELR